MHTHRMDQNPPTEHGVSGGPHFGEPPEPQRPEWLEWPEYSEWPEERAESPAPGVVEEPGVWEPGFADEPAFRAADAAEEPEAREPGSAGEPAFLARSWPAGAGRAKPGATPRPGGRPLPAAIYWRRRVIALALGITLLAILGWAVNGTLSAPGPGSAAAMTGRPGGDTKGSGGAQAQSPGALGAGQGSAGQGSAGQWSAGQGGAAGGAGSRRAAASASAGPGSAGAAGSAGRTHARAAPPCSRQDVVLTLLTRRRWYGPARRPEFLAEAISTGQQPCRFNVGARFMSIVVTAGRSTIWSSADCVRQARSRPVVLTRGVPAAIWASWDRKSTAHGCRPTRRHVRAGTYTVMAVTRHDRSRPIVFVLSGPGVAAP
jgi:hypothetical protein